MNFSHIKQNITKHYSKLNECKVIKYIKKNSWTWTLIGIFLFIIIPILDTYCIKNTSFNNFSAFMVLTVLFSFAIDFFKLVPSIIIKLKFNNQTLKHHYYKKEVCVSDLVMGLFMAGAIILLLWLVGYVEVIGGRLSSIHFIEVFENRKTSTFWGTLFGYFACYKLVVLGLESYFSKNMEQYLDKYKIIFAFIYYNHLLNKEKESEEEKSNRYHLFSVLFKETKLMSDEEFNKIFPSQGEIDKEKLSDELEELEYIMDIVEKIHSNNLNEQNLREILQHDIPQIKK